MSNKQQHLTAHYRALLLHRELVAEHQIALAHARATAAIQPHIDALMKELADKQATLEEGEKLPLTWLYEQHRLSRLKAVIAAHIDTFAGQAHAAAAQAQQQGAQLGEQAAHTQLEATKPVGVAWAFKKAGK